MAFFEANELSEVTEYQLQMEIIATATDLVEAVRGKARYWNHLKACIEEWDSRNPLYPDVQDVEQTGG
jgi:hypothetical protein